MTFWDHLDELRARLVRSLIAVGVCAAGGFFLSDYIQHVLTQPFTAHVAGSLALLAPADGFVVQVKIALLAGLIIAAPFVSLQLYGFVGPGLKRQEKLWLWPVVLISTVLFWGGVIFAWYVLPAAITFLGSFAEFGIANLWSLKNYINLVLFLLLAFGLIFQLPLLIGVLIAAGLVPSRFFRRNRRYAIVVMFILAALATPTTDAVTMILMALPLVVLYELSIWVGLLIETRRQAAKVEAAP